MIAALRFPILRRVRPRLGDIRTFAAPAKSKAAMPAAAQPAEDQAFIDMDTEKLTKYCCCNYLKEGSDISLKPDSEYPPWLFKMRLGTPPSLDELDPADLAYWKRHEEFALKERLERRRQYYSSTFTQQWLTNVKKIPLEDTTGSTAEWERRRGIPPPE